MKKNIDKKLADITGDYNRQKCICGHSLFFLPSTEYLWCTYCGRRVINKTKGHFITEVYKKVNESKRI